MTDKILVSGFTFIKNGLTLGYPIRESIESIEPLCDEIIINVGYDDKNLQQDDGTYDFLKSYFTHPKFKFIKSWWDPSIRKSGLILSQQTNIALAECCGEICQYIQGDEVIHEDDLPAIHNGYIEMLNNPQIEGLVFDYIHFYGNVDIYKYTRNIYRREVRAIRNKIGLQSWMDAQGFRQAGGGKPLGIRIKARIMHYGWARKEQIMSAKVREFEKLYHDDSSVNKNFSYQKVWGMKKFTQTHPKVMGRWIEQHRNSIDFFSLKLDVTFRKFFEYIGLVISDAIERATDYRLGEFKNYRLYRD
ncbi:MAG: hypothetical protein A2504_12005 [Bdellovibrionales bacterium RIFOXYD12_FULL_39_22]|nr:MAG: hypothetical protein A2385_16520 [Bdellovibrionales bacterium RIFOXYB1_FULL_39_21]OFZ44439.1 MAG: hypothetical protein A2485_06375 [Bdellovibrionales bacterium RIFOXYC12_FULL_39_17]OFZ49919.1 MAG: hypothetical protein A2404_01090 [Bdellovibrionales bacterium RIFOXYC1_FULL_39_130]OFZ76924.1 MAG: hypothetical protein A2560_05890 [Bdellovibrionales bacterium RIFOXYD1_FULL_39_84]OFZ77137.1 MAG: hypothetical protein A2451_14410 [Bdellovibrionales bacterium RIFOXYC2_FULL_39_8]OFZ95851.1 MAG: